MDPRLLLNPKSLKKDQKRNGMAQDRTSGVPAGHPRTLGTLSPRTVSSAEPKPPVPNRTRQESTPHKAQLYDPRALLNPKGFSKPFTSRGSDRDPSGGSKSSTANMSRVEDSHGIADSTGQNTDDAGPEQQVSVNATSLHTSTNGAPRPKLSGEPSGPKHMLENIYGVENRTHVPRKKPKLEPEDKSQEPHKHHSFVHKGTGIVGSYMKPEVNSQKLVSDQDDIVDLTKDDEVDDTGDIQVIGSRNVLDEEVCYGRITFFVKAYLVPKPANKGSTFAVENQWPLIKCTLLRKRENTNTATIDVLDPFDKVFGTVDAATAVCLAPAMDVLQDLRTQVRVLNRKKKDSEWPWQPCSDQYKSYVNIYGRRGDSQKMGKLFGQANIWFENPLMSDSGVPIENPHKRPEFKRPPPKPPGRGTVLADDRTVEEVNHAVSKIFDHFASESLPETEGPESIITPLLSHQKQALTFMTRHEQERTFGDEEHENTSLWRRKVHKNGRVEYEDPVSGMRLDQEPDQVYGGLLADAMGLGKTLEALALIASTTEQANRFSKQPLLRKNEADANVLKLSRGTLIVCPTSTVSNWESQTKEHVKDGALSFYTYHGPNRKRNAFELAKHDIVITTYGVVQFESRAANKYNPLQQLKWFRIILDEAHTIREPSTTTNKAICSLSAQRRWCLTGTPIQNRIDDLGSLTVFLQLRPYDKRADFNRFIKVPATSGDPSFLMKLRVFIDSFTLRRSKEKIDLPPKRDEVHKLRFSTAEQDLHDFFRERASIQVEKLVSSKSKQKASGLHVSVLQGITTLRLISAHGRDLLKAKDLASYRGANRQEPIEIDEQDRLPTISQREAYEIVNLMTEVDQDACRNCFKRLSGDTPSAEMDTSEDSPRCVVLPCKDTICADCFNVYRSMFPQNDGERQPISCPFCEALIAAQYVSIEGPSTDTIDTLPDDEVAVAEVETDTYSGPHTKTKALLADLEAMMDESAPLMEKGKPPLKAVVFSEYTSHLTLIERALTDNGHAFVRIDGSMSLAKRKKVLDAFDSNDAVRILLASIKAAGQGLNLTVASRAFIMEPMWNPAAEAQAVDRVYRIGQKREVIVKRYRMQNSIEEVIVNLAKKKQMLADVSMDRNHKQLSKKEVREQHMKELLSIFRNSKGE